MLLVLALAAPARGQPTPSPVHIDNGTWTATDDLGRTLPTAGDVGPPSANRWVGLFYWQWHGGLRATADYDLTAFLAGHPKFTDFVANPPGGPANPTGYWPGRCGTTTGPTTRRSSAGNCR